MKKFFRTKNIIPTLTFGMGTHSYYMALKNEKLNNRLEKAENTYNEAVNNYTKLVTEIEKKEQILDEAIQETQPIANEISGQFTNIEQSQVKIQDIVSNVSPEKPLTKEKAEVIQSEMEKITSNANSASDNFNKIQEILEGINKKGSGNQFLESITHYINVFKEYLSSLDTLHLGALFHLLGCLCLFISLFNIIIIFYGEYLIKKFKITEKYPKLSGFIRLRSKFQHFYLLTNVIYMVLILSVIVSMNIYIFM